MKRMLAFLLLGISLNSCIPMPTEQGVCKTTEGDVNTYNVIGVWKKVPETNAEKRYYSGGNYRILYVANFNEGSIIEGEPFDGIEPVYFNSLICEEDVSNTQRSKLIKKGLYFHDDGGGRSRIKTQMVDLTADDDDPQEELLTYSFTGNCLETKLILRDESGDEDVYTFVNNVVPSDACKVPETSN